MADPTPPSDGRPSPTQAFMAALPHARALGLEMQEAKGGRAVIALPYAPQLIGDPESGVIHGGAVSALLDTAAGAAVMSHPDVPAATATLNLRVDYMRPATPGQAVVAEALCYHVTRSVAFVRVTARDDDPDRPVAAAAGAFTVSAG